MNVTTVYPRACGGTRGGAAGAAVGNGLSPRLRGNPIFSAIAVLSAGSIPAPAGEPLELKGGSR